jgi:hypothetical protein
MNSRLDQGRLLPVKARLGWMFSAFSVYLGDLLACAGAQNRKCPAKQRDRADGQARVDFGSGVGVGCGVGMPPRWIGKGRGACCKRQSQYQGRMSQEFFHLHFFSVCQKVPRLLRYRFGLEAGYPGSDRRCWLSWPDKLHLGESQFFKRQNTQTRYRKFQELAGLSRQQQDYASTRSKEMANPCQE